MPRSWLTVTIALAFAPACSHEQKLEAKPSALAQVAPAPPRRAPVAAPATPAVPEISKPKEDQAVFFDFDSALVRDDARPVLQKVASEIREGNGSVEIEGNCDELGTVEYNLALGEQRARAAKEYLIRLGIPSSRVLTKSYGSQRPKYPGHSDEDRAKNRRDDLVLR